MLNICKWHLFISPVSAKIHLHTYILFMYHTYPLGYESFCQNWLKTASIDRVDHLYFHFTLASNGVWQLDLFKPYHIAPWLQFCMKMFSAWSVKCYSLWCSSLAAWGQLIGPPAVHHHQGGLCSIAPCLTRSSPGWHNNKWSFGVWGKESGMNTKLAEHVGL